MIEDIKKNMHLLVLANIALSLMILIQGVSSETVRFINVNGLSSTTSEKELKMAICELGFNKLKENEADDFHFHPDLLDEIDDDTKFKFDLSDVEKMYFKFEGRDICKIVARTKEGFTAFEAVIGEDGPLLYRITSVVVKKPTLKDVKDYL